MRIKIIDGNEYFWYHHLVGRTILATCRVKDEDQITALYFTLHPADIVIKSKELEWLWRNHMSALTKFRGWNSLKTLGLAVELIVDRNHARVIPDRKRKPVKFNQKTLFDPRGE